MIDFLRWLLAIEVISLAFLPLAVWVLRSLPDRGYIFARVLGLLLITYVTWIIGSFIPVAGSVVLPVAVGVVAAGAGWWFWGRQTLALVREAGPAVAVEEALFVVGLAVWALLRVHTFGASINHTEQLMDVAFLNASYHSTSYPPYDPWMSGGTINYYYFGYLAVAMLCKLSHTATDIGFNLANATLFALTASCAYSIGFALCRRVAWSLIAPGFVALAGNWHAVLWQSAHGTTCGSDTFWNAFWESTRVIGSGFTLSNWAAGPPWTHAAQCANPNATITEYPLFSFVLGDMHPHVLALPFTLLTVALAASILLAPAPFALAREPAAIGRFLLIAVAAGALFAINSWDFITYLLLISAGIAVSAYLNDESRSWWRAPAGTIAALAIASVVLYAPFYLHLKSPTHGIGFVNTPSDLFEFVQVFGLFLLAAVLLVVALGLLLQPASEEEEATSEPVLAGEPGQAKLDTALWIAALVVAFLFVTVLHQTVLVLLATLGLGALVVLHRVLNTEEPNRGDALALLLTVLGCLVLAIPEVVYLRDSFDASVMYRMNTVFKFYYQGWVLLGLAGAYGAYRAWGVFLSVAGDIAGWTALALVTAGALAAGTYTAWAPSAVVAQGAPQTLDGMAWLATAQPGEYAAIRWLQSNVSGHPVVLEATQPQGGDYQYSSPVLYAGVSAFTGLPTVMGWKGHEEQWGRDPAVVDQRARDVATIYSTHSIATARRLLQHYSVRYLVVGETERQTFGSAGGLSKFGRFMKVAFSAPGVTVYRS